MKTMLRDIRTGLLFRNMDEWTAAPDKAAGFRDTLAALKFCQRHNLTGVAAVHTRCSTISMNFRSSSMARTK